MKKHIIINIIVLTLISSVSTGCYENDQGEGDYEKLTYTYSIEIFQCNQTPYYIWIPVPMKSDDPILNITKKINKGTLIDTDKGVAMNISGKEDIKLISSSNKGIQEGIQLESYLSMWNLTDLMFCVS